MYTAPIPGSGVLLNFMLNVLDYLLPAPNEQIMWQRLVETFKWAYAKRTELEDPNFSNSKSKILNYLNVCYNNYQKQLYSFPLFTDELDALIQNLTSKEYAKSISLLIKDEETHSDPEFYGSTSVFKPDHGTTHVSVLAPDGSAVSVTSTINHA